MTHTRRQYIKPRWFRAVYIRENFTRKVERFTTVGLGERLEWRIVITNRAKLGLLRGVFARINRSAILARQRNVGSVPAVDTAGVSGVVRNVVIFHIHVGCLLQCWWQ